MSVEVLERGQQTLGELATEANREHALVRQAGESMIEHAICAGQYLLTAKERVGHGQWREWLADNFEASDSLGLMYMRVARFADEVRRSEVPSLGAALRYISAEIDAPHPNAVGHNSVPDWKKLAARAMREDGMTWQQIADDFGIAEATARRWGDPAFADRHKAIAARNRARQRRELALAAERARDKAIKQAVKKAGAATAELYAMAERMQDVLAQAQRETDDRDAKRALSEAGVHYRKMRDDIVRALGVT